MAAYNTLRMRGLENNELVVHMCHNFTDDKNMVEFHTLGGCCTVLSQEQFNILTEWINQQFEILSKVVRSIH